MGRVRISARAQGKGNLILGVAAAVAVLLGAACGSVTTPERPPRHAGANPGSTQHATQHATPSGGPSGGPGPTSGAPTPWNDPRTLTGPAHLAAGSDPSVLPGPVLVADKKNHRLVVIDPQGRIRWQFPRRGDLRPGQTFLVPDDAFFAPDGKEIIATQEDDFVVTLVDVATHRIVYRYGTPGRPGAGSDHLDNPDDAMVLPGGQTLVADIKNCRILLIGPGAHRPTRVFGATHVCRHDPPRTFGSPNGAFPMANGDFLVTEINGDWVDEMGLDGTVSWSAHPPRVAYPSDSNEISPGRYLTVDYSTPGQIVIFDKAGRTLWRYRPTGVGELRNPSLALPLPNGDIIASDDFNNRIIVVDPHTNKIVWQYGHTGIASAVPGYLSNPDGIDLAPPFSLVMTHSACCTSRPRR